MNTATTNHNNLPSNIASIYTNKKTRQLKVRDLFKEFPLVIEKIYTAKLGGSVRKLIAAPSCCNWQVLHDQKP